MPKIVDARVVSRRRRLEQPHQSEVERRSHWQVKFGPVYASDIPRYLAQHEKKTEIAHSDRCIRCGACVVQCPTDALSFEDEAGQRIEPETIRCFKLNLLGDICGCRRGGFGDGGTPMTAESGGEVPTVRARSSTRRSSNPVPPVPIRRATPRPPIPAEPPSARRECFY